MIVPDDECSRLTLTLEQLSRLPRSVDAEGRKVLSFAVVERVLNDAIDAAAARAAFEAGAQIFEIGGLAGSDNFNGAIFGVAHPAAQFEFAGLALHEPAETYALYAALNEEVKDQL